MEDILILLLGLFLGSLSSIGVPFIIEHFKKEQLKKDYKVCVFSELKENHNKLINNIYLIYSRYGLLDKDKINWLLKNYRSVCEDSKVINKLEEISGLSEEELNQSQIYRALVQESKNTSLTYKKFSLSYLDSHLNILSLFGSNFQSKILHIRDRIILINDHIDYLIFFYKKTFDDISEENSEILKLNSISGEKKLADWAKQLVDKINEVYLL